MERDDIGYGRFKCFGSGVDGRRELLVDAGDRSVSDEE